LQEETYAFPLSFAQQRLWFLDRMAPGNPFYNIPLAVPIAAAVNISALERTVNALVARHESLRTVFRVIDGEPAQVVLPPLASKIAVSDLRQHTPAERDARTVELATQESQTPFDLEAGPLIRCGLVIRGAADHVLLITMHHIISDGWSMGILAQELTTLYQGFASGYAARLPELPIQYPDFAMWQREQLQGAMLEELLSYWRGQLADLPVLDLPADHPRPPALTYRGAFHRIAMPAALSTEVRRFAHEHHATPFMVLLAAFAALLQRYSGQEDLVIGTPVANRNRSEIEGLIGFFVNSLVLRISTDGDPTFGELVARTREVALDAYAHQDLPFEKLVEELHPVRDPARNPLFQVTFQLIDFPTMQKTAGNAANMVQVQRGTAIFDLAFTLMEDPAGFTGVFEYSTDLFEAETMGRLDAHFQRLVREAIEQPNVTLSGLSLLDEDERAELLERSRGPVTEPTVRLVHQAIAAQAERTPDAIAVGSVTYRELAAEARGLAQHLPAAPVAILMDRSPELAIALLAVLEAGGAYVPLDPSYPAERLRFMLDDSGARTIVTHAAQEQRARDLAGDSAIVVWDGARQETSPRTAPAVHPEDLAYILYTSGSTGRPKGVAISHRALANHMQWMLARFPLDATDRVLQRTPYAFDASVWELFAPLMCGAQLVMLPPDAHRNPELTVAHIARDGITVVQAVPAMLRMLLDEPELYTCASLRRIFSGGEALSDPLREKITNALGVELVNLYGPTEATIDAMYYVCGADAEPFGVPIGEPVCNTQTYVLDDKLGLAPIGVEGELYIGGRSLARGYFQRPALTAERFVPDPHSDVPGARMYRTGDRVRRRADGMLLFTGRADEQVKIRGFRVEPGEIETLIRAVPGVQNCAVVAESDSGEATALTAFLVPNARETDADAVSDMAREHVARWEEVYQQVYGDLSSAQEPAFDIVGWNSSYTGRPLSMDEMAEWRESTVARIRRLHPRRVLEIGCGTGLLLTQIAPHCEQYVATDFAAPVIDHLREHFERFPRRGRNVTLLQRGADDFSGIEPGSFDTVILNSVAQYFPDAEYFAAVLRGAVRAVAPGGAIFAGDLRSLPLLEAFQLSLALHRGASDGDPDGLLQRVRLGAEQEQELVLDPRLLHALAAEIDGIGAIESSIKRGCHSNELTRFRYDVVLRIGKPELAAAPRTIDWHREQLTPDGLDAWLEREGPDRLIVAGIPNARVTAEVAWLEPGAEHDAAAAVDPELLRELGEKHGYDVRIRFSAPPRIGSVDVVLRLPDAAPIVDTYDDPLPEIGALANNPMRGAITRRIASRVRDAIATHLPAYMVPSAFVLVDALPLLPNGKLNRAALSALRVVRNAESNYRAPRTPLEEALSILWAEVADLPRAGIRDDFFTDLGGHSLLATRLISRIRGAFRIAIPLKQVFATPTVEAFAGFMLDGAPPEERRRIENAAELIVKLNRMSEAELDDSLRATRAL
jgi:amino acid adenylation domain-containing protein